MIILDSDEDATVALTSPIRKVGHAMFRLFRYSPDYNPRKEATTTTKWVRLPDLHPGFFTRNYISGIVNVFGHFLDVDERTKACASQRFARVCVEVDVTKAIPKEVQLTLSYGRKFKKIIEVEGNMAYCSHCRVHGHILDQCRKKKLYMDYKNVGEEYHNARFDSVQIKMGNGHNPSITIPDAPVGKGSKSKEDNNQDGWTEIKKRHRGRGRESSDVAKKADKQSVLNAGVTHKPISFVAERCVAKESLEKGVDSHMEEAGVSAVVVSTVKSSGVDNRHEKGIDSHMEVVEEVHNRQANELAMVAYGTGLPEQVGKIVVEENFLVKENGELPSNGIAETSDRNAENGELPSNEDMQSSDLHLDDGTSEASAAKYRKVPVTADKDNQVVRSQFLDDYIKWSNVNGEFEDFLDYCKKQGFTRTYGSSITIEDSERVDEDRIITHNSDYEVCNQDGDTFRKSIPAKTRPRKNKGSRSSTRSCPKQKDTNFIRP